MLKNKPSSRAHHSNGITADHSVYIQDDVVSHVGQDVDHGDNGHGDRYGQGQIPAGGN